MRAVCVIILASLTVLQCQDLPDESDELFQRAETLLIRSILTQMEDENNDNGEQLVSPAKRQHPGKREDEESARLRRQHPGKRLSLDEPMILEDLEKRQHPGKRLCEDWDEPGCGQASILLELLDNANKSRAEEKRQHPGKRFELEADQE
ncbi:hypothetical protein PO909_017760 [Leuciscus waleckii]